MNEIVPKSPEGAPRPIDPPEVAPTPNDPLPRWEPWFTLAALVLFTITVATVGPTREVVGGFIAIVGLGLGRSVSDWFPWK